MDEKLNQQIEAALATAVAMANQGCNVTDLARDLRSARDRSRARLNRIRAEAAAQPQPAAAPAPEPAPEPKPKGKR